MSRIFFSLIAAAGFLFVSGANDAQAGFGCLSKLFGGHGCCESSCCETTCCEPVCCEPVCEPACCEPTCCDSCDSCCDTGCGHGHGLGLGKLFGWLHNLKGHGCGSSCCGGGYESSCCGGY